jgi:N-methylhydantoinase B
MGGGGYGDPIEREPAAVARDVREGFVTERAAREIYGVVIGSDGEPDVGATRARRLDVRSLRAGREVEEALGERAAVPASGMRISEYLQRTSGGATQCTWCGHELAPTGADWKGHARLHRSPVSKAGSNRSDGQFWLVEACCPRCGTLLDTDLALGDDPPLHDRIASWPGVAATAAPLAAGEEEGR